MQIHSGDYWTGTGTKRLLLWLLLSLSVMTTAAFADEAQKVKVVADYSNITTSMPEDPHQSGYAVTIYKRAYGLLFGDFTFAAGSTEGAGGKLFDLHFDKRRLAFKAKTSAYEGPSRELFDFNGAVIGSALVGTLKVWNGYDLKKPPSVQWVKLKRGKTAMPLSYEAHQELFQKDSW